MRLGAWCGLGALGLGLLSGVVSPGGARAESVGVEVDLGSPSVGIFPSDLFTVRDPRQLTGRRVQLPLPDCDASPTECDEVETLNMLDGFNLQPRASITFDGPIDETTVTRDSIVFLSLGDTVRGGGRGGERIGVNQVVWDPDSLTLFVESDELLDQHTRYALIVTRAIRDAKGRRIERASGLDVLRGLRGPSRSERRARAAYVGDLREAARRARRAGIRSSDIAAISVFTTLSTTATLEKIRRQLDAARPPQADFELGIGGERTVFSTGDVDSIVFNRQVATDPVIVASPVPIQALQIRPGSTGTIAFGRYRSPEYRDADQFLPQVGSRFGRPRPFGQSDIVFNLILPAGTPPSGGWPVALFGHGFGGNKEGLPLFAAILAERGIATMAINVAGHGGGDQGMLRVTLGSGAEIDLLAGGRGIDQDGDGMIGGTEGLGTRGSSPRRIASNRDGLRQTVIDLMQLLRVIRGGVDVDGDGARDLNGDRVFYFGVSLGGIYGTMLLAVEPNLVAGVPNVPGGFLIDVANLSPAFRPLIGLGLAVRTPSLINVDGPTGIEYDDNMPLRNQPPRVNDVPGALPIQEFLERSQWVANVGDPVTYAPHIRKEPLRGLRAKPVIVQFAKGDRTVPNPTASALVRAGALTDRTTFLRNDLLFAMAPDTTPTNPHGFLARITDPLTGAAGQIQIATFFDSGGQVVIDPDGDGPIFEVPIAGELPEDLSFIFPPAP